MKKKYNTVIFDLDGTLVDSTEGIISSVKFTISKLNLSPLTEKELLTFIGPPVQNSFKRFYNLGDKTAQAYAEIFRNNYKKEDIYKANIYNNIINLLKFLKENNYKVGIATYKREDYAINLIKHLKLNEQIDVICGADNKNILNKSDIINICIENLQADKETSVMIGDTIYDAEASIKSEVDFIAVTYGFGFKSSEVKISNTIKFIASKPDDLIEYFKENKRISF